MSGKLYVARSSQIAARKLDDEMMIMSAVDSTLFTLNETATIVWEAADGATPLDEIVTLRICASFDVAPNEALEDAEEMVRRLADYGILLLSEEPIVATNLARQASA
jgi:hypothetical protein